ncbi:MAG: alpha/beta hydrolase [Hyphomonadaceae bacterium]
MRWLLTLIGLIAVVGLVGYFVLKRPDIPYETLAARYESAASRYVDLPSGVRMHYRDEGDPEAPAIVLLHGFSSSLHTWEPWSERLTDMYRVISLDLPGHGLTRAPAGYQGSIDAFVEAVAQFAETQGLDQFAIAGNSMGGHVAWEYTLAHPEQVNALILVDAAGWEPTGESANEPIIFKLLRNPVSRAVLRDLDNTALVRQGLQASFSDQSLVTDEMVTRYVDLARAPGHRDILLQIMTRPRNYATPERLSQITAPTLIIHGDQDNLIPPSAAQQFNDAIAGSDMLLIEGVGHLPQEEAPDASAQEARDLVFRVIEGSALAPVTE